MTTWSAITWETARAAGLIAYVLLTATVSLGLVLGNRWQSARWPRLVTNDLHGYLSLLGLVFITIHVLAIAIDPFTHFGLAAVLLPFVSSYRPIWMGLGVVSLYLLLAVWVSTKLRRRIGHRLWRRIHLLAFVIYAAATFHGLGAGSDTRAPWALSIYAVSVAIVGSLVGARLLVTHGRGTRTRPGVAVVTGAGLVAALAWAIVGPLDGHWGRHQRQAAPRPALAATTRVPSRTQGRSFASALVNPPFTARFTGRLSVEPADHAGRVTVRIDGALTGPTHDHLEILLHGMPLDGGGVAMEQSRVRMGARTAVYTGRIAALRGTTLVALLRSSRRQLRLAIGLHVHPDGRVLGTVHGTVPDEPGRTA